MITNLTWLNEFCAGNPQRIKKYCNIFITQVPLFIEQAETALIQNDFVSLAKALHAFKAQLIYFGLKEDNRMA